MVNTTHLALTLVDAAQAQKEITVNTALSRIDAILNTGAITRSLSTPPGSPADGDVYIVGGSPTGAWSGFSGKITYFDQIWRFIIPLEGMSLWVNDEDIIYTYNGSNWFPLLAKARQTWQFMATDMKPSATGGASVLAQVATSANRPDILTLDFNASTAQYAQFFLPMPKGWDLGTVSAQFLWSHASTTTNFGVVWGIQAVAVSDADLLDVAYGTAQTITDTGGATNVLYISPETSAITIAGTPAVGDMVCFRVYRDATAGADTLAINARLHAVKLYYTVTTLTDA